MSRTIFTVWFYTFVYALIMLVWFFPETIGEWQARKDIAYEDAWEETVP
jgi:hypothetical protein